MAALLGLDLEDFHHLLEETRSVCLVPLDSASRRAARAGEEARRIPPG